jgi:hypothetical protein
LAQLVRAAGLLNAAGGGCYPDERIHGLEGAGGCLGGPAQVLLYMM